MVDNPHTIRITSQRKKLKINFIEAFKAVIKTVKDIATVNIEETGLDLLDLAKALSLATTVEQKSYLLIAEGYSGAISNIWRDNWLDFKQSNEPKDMAKVAERFDLAITNNPPELLPDFFIEPNKLPILETFIGILNHELIPLLNDVQKADSISKQFPSQFYNSIVRSWNKKHEFYEDIWLHFQNNQFLDLNRYLSEFRINTDRVLYHDKIKSLYHDKVFEDSKGMTLRDIYVEPNFRVSERCFDEKDKRLIEHEKQDRHSPFVQINSTNEIETVHDVLLKFIKTKDPLQLACPQAQVLLLLGYPGQGKTSFCKRCIYDLQKGGKPEQNIFYLPLRHIENVKEKLSNPMDMIMETFNSSVLDLYPGGVTVEMLKDSIIFLDGLDEIFQREGLSHEDIDNFCKDLGRITNDLPKIRIIITSRYGYITLSKLSKKRFLIIQLEPFNSDQQITWLEKFKKFHTNINLSSELMQKINNLENKNFNHLRELVNQPILLQLVASSNTKLEENDTRSKIYDRLFQALTDRMWAKEGQLENLEELEKEDVINYLSEIALEIYHSEFEYIRKQDLDKLDTTKEFQDKLRGVSLKDALKNLMVAFYFRDVKKAPTDNIGENNYAIEFLHKSLQEYLIAKKIWITVKNSFLDYSNRKRKYNINSWSEALSVIRELFSKKPLSVEIQSYLLELIQNNEIEEKKELQERLIHFLPDLVNRDFWGIQFQHDYSSAFINESLDCFYGYWTLISLIGLHKNLFPKPLPARFFYLLRCPRPSQSNYYWVFDSLIFKNVNLRNADFRRASLVETIFLDSNLEGIDLSGADLENAKIKNSNLKGVKFKPSSAVRLKVLGRRRRKRRRKMKKKKSPRKKVHEPNYYDQDFALTNIKNLDLTESNLSETIFDSLDLSGIVFKNVNFEGSSLRRTELINSDLSNANLTEVNLIYANLTRGNLSEVDLTGIDLSGVNLSEVDLSGIDLSGVNLSGAILSGIDLKEIDLSVVDLSGVNLPKVDLTSIDLSGVDLTGVNLSEANLSGVDLSKTKIVNANMSRANLSEVDLKGVDLSGVIFFGVDFSKVNLSGVDLSGVNLSEANLSGVDLSETKIVNADLSYANLSRANLSGVDLSGVNLSEADLSGVHLSEAKIINAYLYHTVFSGVDFKGVDLSGVDLSRTNLSKADLSGIDFSKTKIINANLSFANISRANLIGANLLGVDLSGVDLSRVDLVGVNFREVILSNMDFSDVNLSGVNFQGAILSNMDLSGVDLSKVNLQDVVLSKINLSKKDLSGINLQGATLFEVNFSGANLNSANFKETSLLKVDFTEANLSFANFTAAKVLKTNFYKAKLSDIEFNDLLIDDLEWFESLVNSKISLDDIRYLHEHFQISQTVSTFYMNLKLHLSNKNIFYDDYYGSYEDYYGLEDLEKMNIPILYHVLKEFIPDEDVDTNVSDAIDYYFDFLKFYKIRKKI